MMNPEILVTAIVPSYNHGPFIRKRIESILQQTYKNIELIVIDDNSADNSCETINNLLKEHDFKFISNPENSGSPFSAWEKVISIGKGSYFWICESDDFAHPKFLETAIRKITEKPGTAVFYCNSYIVDEEDNIVDHTSTYFHETWKQFRWDNDFFCKGSQELCEFQIRGQTVPNMSSALIFAPAFKKAYTPVLKKFKLTGDWLFIGLVYTEGNIAFSTETLSYFRKHENTARIRVRSNLRIAEFSMAKLLLFQHANVPIRKLSVLLETDFTDYLFEKTNMLKILSCLIKISPINTATMIFHTGISLVMNREEAGKYLRLVLYRISQ
jgi:glycosyltransferase involved in cell wall biosynthesis